jgi:ribosome maturation factor RimP
LKNRPEYRQPDMLTDALVITWELPGGVLHRVLSLFHTLRYTKSVEPTQCAKAHFFIGWNLVRSGMSQSNKDIISAKVSEIAERVGLPDGIEIVEVQILGGGKARLVRIYIDKPSGVTHADCQRMSHEVGEVLDAEDTIPGGAYTLEVSSPGVERKLSKPADFQRFLGQKAKVVLHEPVENQRSWIGTLAALEGNVLTLEPSAGKTVQIALDQVERANLKFEWK